MATITAQFGLSYNLNQFVAYNLTTGLYYEGTATDYIIQYDDADTVSPIFGAVDYFQGFNFSYVSPTDPTPVSGTITAYSAYFDEVLYLTATGLSLSAVDLASAATTLGVDDDLFLYRSQLQGADTITGSFSADYIEGFGGNDTLSGQAGADVLIGGRGRDTMFGGGQHDYFVFNSTAETGRTATTRDVIKDFVHNQDDIFLRGIDAKIGAGNQAFRFIGDDAFHRIAGELHYKFSGGNTLVEGDVNGDGRADFQIQLSGRINLSQGDFVL